MIRIYPFGHTFGQAFGRASLLAGAAVFALSSTGAQAAVDQYSVEGSSQITVNLKICSAETQLAVRGDTGTDLDFTLTDSRGNAVHEDAGVDDYLSLIVEKDDDACETFGLGVVNLGEDSNDFIIILEPITESSIRVQKYIVQASETQTIKFKACGTSARVTVTGDGDTDVDYVIRNSDGGIVHEDEEGGDTTRAELAGLLSDCEIFDMDLVNLGPVYNALMLVVEPKGAPGTAFAGTAPSTSLDEVYDEPAVDFGSGDFGGDGADTRSPEERKREQMASSPNSPSSGALDLTAPSPPARTDGDAGAAGAFKSTLAPPGRMVGKGPIGVSPDGQDRRIAILNQTGETLSGIFWSNSATLEWGVNRLGRGQSLARDQQWNVSVFDGSSACLFDFRAVTEGAREIEVVRVNVCEAGSVVVE